MIVFLGDKPSKKNVDANIPFVGTKSYKTLLEWVSKLGIDITEVALANREHVKTYNWAKDLNTGEGIYVETPNIYLDILPQDKIVCLGDSAEKLVKPMGLKYFKLPHPSGLNRKINNKQYLEAELKKCKRYLNE